MREVIQIGLCVYLRTLYVFVKSFTNLSKVIDFVYK